LQTASPLALRRQSVVVVVAQLTQLTPLDRVTDYNTQHPNLLLTYLLTYLSTITARRCERVVRFETKDSAGLDNETF